MFISFILVLLLLVTMFLVNREIQNFNQEWASDEKLLILNHDKQMVVGIAGKFHNLSDMPHVLTESEMVVVSDLLKTEILPNQYQYAAVFTMDAFSGLKGEISFYGIPISVEQVKSLLLSPSPTQSLKQMVKGLGLVLPIVIDDKKMKGLLFVFLVQESVHQDPGFLAKQYKEEKIKLIPENAVLKLIKYLPLQVYENLKIQLSVG